ncbi:probable RNA-dependent RNA polymerase 4 isoform X1 [Oryza glaberrima]|nr:probable RNA-dependent RNA polymerase 4 isoform X1 [Oryza glaberrima]
MNPHGGGNKMREPALPAAVGAELERLEARLGQLACAEARRQLAELGEPAAARVLRAIGEARQVRTLSGFIRHMANQERMKRNARGIPTAHSAACISGPCREEESISTPLYYNEVQMDAQTPNDMVEVGSPNQQMPLRLHDNGGSVGHIARVVPDLANPAVGSPYGRISSVLLQNQNCVEGYTPSRGMVSPASNQVGSPGHRMPSGLQRHMEIDSPIQPIVSTPERVSTPSPVRDLSRCVENMAGPSGSPPCPIWVMPQIPPAICPDTANVLREVVSPQMLALGELEFRKIFMIFAYLSWNKKGVKPPLSTPKSSKIEDVLSVNSIRSLKSMSMAQFESRIWSTFGHDNISSSDRAKNLDSGPGMSKVYRCNVEIRGGTVVKIFKGPYIENRRTHLQKVLGDDNVLVVNFMEISSDTETDLSTYLEHYHKVAEEGIVLGLRRYRFFLYKDGGKENKMKEENREEENKKCTSSVRCYFVRTESGWNMDEPYILSGRTIGQARDLFMHIRTVLTLAKYMLRFALIVSKTITLDVGLSEVLVKLIDDEPCLDEHGKEVFRDGERLIHTDGTGLISEDLAQKCTYSNSKGKLLEPQDIVDCAASKLMGSNNTTEYPLLIQLRLFYNGSAVKGTVLVDKRLPPRTIHIRPSMLKIKTYPELSGVQSVNSLDIVSARNAKKSLSGVQSVNSFEIVSTSNRPRRTLTSRFLITLLCYGGVPEEYFLELLQSAIEGAENACYDYEDALRIAFSYADMEDSMSARMILSGIPLEESYLQHRLDFMAQQERKGIKQGKIPIDECYYLMGTTDPTGTLRPNEVCVILENGQFSGDVLVYKHPGLHFGDIHVLKATYIRDLEKEYVGYAKYAILFPISGPRSLADEMANSDFDGDIYWVSKNPKLLEHFKPSEPWVQAIKPKKTKQKKPQDCNESKLERLLFHEFLKTRFTPSFALGTAADSWLAYMDRLLTDSLDEIEKKLIEEKMLKLVDLYYLALDAPKTGNKVNIPSDLMVKQYPHFMGRSFSYHSSSILGQIYDKAEDVESLRSCNVQSIGVSLLPCFMEREAPPAARHLWQHRYEEYLTDSTMLYRAMVDKEERNMKFQELYEKYKHMLYDASEFEQTQRDPDDVFSEACVIYQIVYEKARWSNDASRCGFAWKVAGRALCHFYALKNEGDTALCSLPLLRKIIKKDHRR